MIQKEVKPDLPYFWAAALRISIASANPRFKQSNLKYPERIFFSWNFVRRWKMNAQQITLNLQIELPRNWIITLQSSNTCIK